MPYISVEDITEPDTSPVTGLFNAPQNEPVPAGYIGYLQDEDPRVVSFLATYESGS